jgi:hypothetical protein
VSPPTFDQFTASLRRSGRTRFLRCWLLRRRLRLASAFLSVSAITAASDEANILVAHPGCSVALMVFKASFISSLVSSLGMELYLSHQTKSAATVEH